MSFRKKFFIFLFLPVFAAGALFLFRRVSSHLRERPNILFILIETLRADHLGCYGYSRDTSPRMDQIAREGILFTNFYSVAPWTNPTIAALFSGYYPQAVFPPAEHKKAVKQILPPLGTLAVVLHRAGYRTVALEDHPGIGRELHYDQGFEVFHELWHEFPWHQRWEGVAPEKFVSFVGEELRPGTAAPRFLFLHIVYPHQPYHPPAPYNTMFGPPYLFVHPTQRAGMINAYDGDIRYTDELIGRLFDKLKENKVLGKTWIIITADHGEGFWEHGYREHGNTLYNELLRVPLIIYPPGGRRDEPREIAVPVSNVDVYPTVMELAGIRSYPRVDGRSLVGFLKGRSPDRREHPIFSESCHYIKCIKSIAMQTGWQKVIHHPERPAEVYDLLADPDEKNNLADRLAPGALRALEDRIQRHRAVNEVKRRQRQIEESSLDEEIESKLRSLGYLQ